MDASIEYMLNKFTDDRKCSELSLGTKVFSGECKLAAIAWNLTRIPAGFCTWDRAMRGTGSNWGWVAGEQLNKRGMEVLVPAGSAWANSVLWQPRRQKVLGSALGHPWQKGNSTKLPGAAQAQHEEQRLYCGGGQTQSLEQASWIAPWLSIIESL